MRGGVSYPPPSYYNSKANESNNALYCVVYADDAKSVAPSSPDISAPIVWPSKDDYPATYSEELVEYLIARAVFPDVALARGYRVVRPGKPGKSSDDQDYAVTYGLPQVRGGILIPLHPLLGGDPKYQLRHWPADIADKPRVPKFRTPHGQAKLSRHLSP